MRAHKLRSKLRKKLGSCFGKAPFDDEILALDMAKLAHALREAAVLAGRDPKAAVAAYDAIASDGSVTRVFQELAGIRAALLLIDSAPLSEMTRRLEPLAQPDSTFRHSAREILALAAWKSGDLTAARQWTDLIITDPQSPSGVRSRAEVLSELVSAASSKG